MSTPKKPAKLTELRRRRCDNCNTLYRPRKEHQRFCKKECRYEFAKHGSAFGPLKTRLENLCRSIIREDIAQARADTAQLRAELNRLREHFTDTVAVLTHRTPSLSVSVPPPHEQGQR